MVDSANKNTESKNIVLILAWVLIIILFFLVTKTFLKSKEIKKPDIKLEQHSMAVEKGPEYAKVIESRWLNSQTTRQYGQTYGNNFRPKNIQQALETFDKSDVGDNFIQKLNEADRLKKNEDMDNLSSQIADSSEKLEQNSNNKELAKQVQIGKAVKALAVGNFDLEKIGNK